MTDITAKAARVERLLADEDLQKAFTDTRDAILQRFSQIPPSEAEQLVECRRLLQVLQSVEKNLYRAIREGELAEFRAEERKQSPFLGELWWNRKKRA
jgi:hypothetical protein